MIVREEFAFKDPRFNMDFFPQFLPLCDLGAAPPLDTTNRNHRVRLEFLAVYYELNVTQALLLASGRQGDSPERSRLESKLDERRQTLDRMEDYYAPYGVIAEPTCEEGFAINLAFTFPDESRWFLEQKRVSEPWEAKLEFPALGGASNNRTLPWSGACEIL